MQFQIQNLALPLRAVLTAVPEDDEARPSLLLVQWHVRANHVVLAGSDGFVLVEVRCPIEAAEPIDPFVAGLDWRVMRALAIYAEEARDMTVTISSDPGGVRWSFDDVIHVTPFAGKLPDVARAYRTGATPEAVVIDRNLISRVLKLAPGTLTIVTDESGIRFAGKNFRAVVMALKAQTEPLTSLT